MSQTTPSKSSKLQELLSSRDEKAVANYMASDLCHRVFVMAGAGISTSCGIPDFRSPETGLYANLARLKLPFPEAVFEINYFRRNPVPFYTLAHELAPGRFRPSLCHCFIRLLSQKSLLHTHFTQNIDTLERRAGVPDEDIIEAHGSFATSRCIDCLKPYDSDKMKAAIRDQSIPRCPHCKGLVKPDIVFFGEPLPKAFHLSLQSLRSADLLIVMGTSLTVHPFASLTEMVPKHCPRVLVNLEPAGDIGERANDIQLLGHCDDIVRKICKEMGWEEELDKLWDATASTLDEEYLELKEGTAKQPEKNPLTEDTSARKASTLDGTREEAQKVAEKVNAAMKTAPIEQGETGGLETNLENALTIGDPAELEDNAKLGAKEKDVGQTTDLENKTSN